MTLLSYSWNKEMRLKFLHLLLYFSSHICQCICLLVENKASGISVNITIRDMRLYLYICLTTGGNTNSHFNGQRTKIFYKGNPSRGF